MKILLVRDRNVLNTNWLVFYANLLAERGHDVVIACDTYGKLGVLAEGNKLNVILSWLILTPRRRLG